jgi:hypothetical protein
MILISYMCWNSIPGIVEMFHIISEAFIMLLLDGFQSFYS